MDSVVDSREICWTADVLVPLEQTSLTLFVPGRTPLNVIGQFSSMFTYNGRTSKHTVFVIKGLRNNLLELCVSPFF